MIEQIKTHKSTVRRDDLVEPELSYSIVGALFRTFNELGPGLHEKYYQKGMVEAMTETSISFEEQVCIPLRFAGKSIGRYAVDFVVNEKVVVEIKKGDRINRNHANQILAYIKALQVPLGILAYFGNEGVTFKRFVNIRPELYS